MTDTGAGTPLTEIAERHLDRRYPPPGDPMYREPDLSADEWREAYFALADVALRQLDAARSRSATDPAGLDALRHELYRVAGGVTDARVAELMSAAAIPLHGHPIHNEAGYVAALVRSQVTAGIDEALARLSVADGPGPEERPHEHHWTDAPDDETGWYCPSCGVTDYPDREETGRS